MQKKEYDVIDGIERINGAPVPASRVVSLTEAEALFDRQMGRISIKAPKAKRIKPAQKDAPEANKVDNGQIVD